MFQGKLADFITVRMEIGCVYCGGGLVFKRESSSGMSARGEAGAKGLTVASRDGGPTNPRGI